MKSIVIKFIRKILKVGQYESIDSAINRRKIKLEKNIYRTPVSKKDFKNTLLNVGIKTGDNVMVHCSWRQFYNFKGKPEDVINIIKEIVGEEGTLLMPSYGPDRTYFDVNNTPSAAGVLSEVFRLYPGTVRSKSTHFSVCTSGKNANEIISTHFNSEYGFDTNSPYYKFSRLENSKVLFLGLGKEPTKISLFHCAGYILKDKVPYLNEILSNRYKSKLIINNKEYVKDMVIRKPGHQNNNKVFKKIFKSIINKKTIKTSNLHIVVIDAKQGLEKTIQFAEQGIYCYK